MISSLKKIALDQKVSKLLHTQNNHQTVGSEQRLAKVRTTPQTTKYINHKCQVKKNLFNQQKQNFPEGLITIHSPLVIDQKQKTIKFVTQKSLNDKKENFQYFFNSIDEQEASQSIKIILKQKQEIIGLKNIITNIETRERENKLLWERQKYELEKELKERRDQSSMMKSEIIKMTSRIEEKSQYKKYGELQGLAQKDIDFENDKINQSEEREQETVISRMILKVERLSEELQYFIDLSQRLKSQAKQAKEALQRKIYELQIAQEEICQQRENNKKIEEQTKYELDACQQKQTVLTSQLNSYKEEYELLKRRYFIMQSQFRKYSSDFQSKDEQNWEEKHEALAKKYNRLYESYKSLYEQYINRSRETDFVMELGQSDNKEAKLTGQKEHLEGSLFLRTQSRKCGKKMMLHLAHESLNECSQITAPLQNIDSHQSQQCPYPRIILKDLIRQTLKECKGQSYIN